MSSLGNLNFTTCVHCKLKIISYPNQQLCRRQILSSRTSQKHQINKPNVAAARSIQINQVNESENELIITSGNSRLDEFIKETQDNSECCDDFVEWIPSNYLKNIKHLAEGGNSKVYCGTWNLLTIPLALKAINDSGEILNEVNGKKLQLKSDNFFLFKLFVSINSLKCIINVVAKTSYHFME